MKKIVDFTKHKCDVKQHNLTHKKTAEKLIIIKKKLKAERKKTRTLEKKIDVLQTKKKILLKKKKLVISILTNVIKLSILLFEEKK